MLVGLLLGCVPPDPGDDGEGDGVGDDSGGDTSTLLARGPCPTGMVPVPAEEPDYCIDAYEAVVVDGFATAIAGVVPTTGLTYDEAVVVCASTPVTDAKGDLVGWKRMATSEEWEDAADGARGDEGTDYLWGSEWDDSRCVTPLEDGTMVYDTFQPAGSLATCESAFGTFDQIGNSWEWIDSGLVTDTAGWLAAREAEGAVYSLDADGVRLVSGDLDVRLGMGGVRNGSVQLAEDTRLYLPWDNVETGYPMSYGYLVKATVEGSERGADDYLVVELVADEVAGVWWVVASGEDGAPLPDKRGGSYYQGGPSDCGVRTLNILHHHTERGTLAFRCSADPL
ncbi:MAG: SUMF1/EgtB/PvdO family nonheme iron enzyme [Myxococcota bacterium]